MTFANLIRSALFTTLLLALVVGATTLIQGLANFAIMIVVAGLFQGSTPEQTAEISKSLQLTATGGTFLLTAAAAFWVISRWLRTPTHLRPEFLRQFFLYEALTAGAVLVLFPFFWMLCTSFKPAGQELKIDEKNPLNVVPATPTFANFKKVVRGNLLGFHFKPESGEAPILVKLPAYVEADFAKLVASSTPIKVEGVRIRELSGEEWVRPGLIRSLNLPDAPPAVPSMIPTQEPPRLEGEIRLVAPDAALGSPFVAKGAIGEVAYEGRFGRFFLNSLWVSSLAAALVTLFASMAGYVFAKKELPYKKQLFELLMTTMMIPGMMYMVPQFFMVVKMGLYGTTVAMYLPHLASVFGVFMMKQFMETIPSSLIEAARIDGASEWQIFGKVIIPLAKPIVLTLFLLTFLFHWSNFLWQLIVSDPSVPGTFTLPVGLALFRGQYSADVGQIMAASCFSIVPIAILFLIAQRYFIEGMTQGAVKE